MLINGNIISFGTHKQKTVSLSTMEAELVAMTTVLTDAIWIRQWLKEILNVECSLVMNCDNQSCLHILKQNDSHSTTKHIDIKLWFIKDQLSMGYITPKWINTDEMMADVLTKNLPTIRFEGLINKLLQTTSMNTKTI